KGIETLKQKANDALVCMVVCNALPPHLVDNKFFKKYTATLNAAYLSPSSTTFNDILVPQYAAATRKARREYLQTCYNLQISFDGGKLLKKGFYSIHVTTTDRRSFCVDLADVSRVSHSGKLIYELLATHIKKIGPHRFSGTCSDDASPCENARGRVALEWPWILDMPDACHNINNAVKDICNLPDFKD
ncbi:hypothetical protein AX16_001643, partial [Volvariella volvacea WC 439]